MIASLGACFALLPTPAIVMLVEDESDVREVLRATLEREGFVVLEADDAGSAWELARRQAVNAVVLDFRLPGLDGGILARQLRQLLGRAVPVVGFTGYPDEVRVAHNPAFDAVLAKPEVAPVVETLRRLLPPAA